MMMKPLQIAFWRHQPVADQTALTLAEATLGFHEAVGGDFVKLTPAGTYQAHAMGLRDKWDNDPLGRRCITARPIQTPSDWLKLDTVDFGEHETNCLEAATWLANRLAPNVPLLATIFSPVTQAMQLAGSETLGDHIRQAPTAVHQGLSCIEERTRRLTEAYGKCGVSGLYYVSQHHVQDTFVSSGLSPALSSIESRILSPLGDLSLNIMHFHGAPLVPDLPILPRGWRVHYEWISGNPNPRDWATHRPEQLVSGIPTQVLQQGHSESARRTLIEQVTTNCTARNSIISAACVLPLDFPIDLAAAWVQSATDFSRERHDFEAS